MALPVYWINLDTSLSRRENLLKEMAKTGISDHRRIPAIHPGILHKFHFVLSKIQRDLIPAEWCCTLSHLKAIWTAWKTGLDAVLIIEDDIQFIRNPTSAQAWQVIKDSIHEPAWDILQLLCFGDIAINMMLDPQAPVWVPWRSGIWSTGAYIINRAGMKKVLSCYAPGTLLRDSWTDTDYNDVDFSSLNTDDPRARCVADYVLYDAAKTLSCTDVFMTEVGKDSTIKNAELPLHLKSIHAIRQVIDTQQYKLDI